MRTVIRYICRGSGYLRTVLPTLDDWVTFEKGGHHKAQGFRTFSTARRKR